MENACAHQVGRVIGAKYRVLLVRTVKIVPRSVNVRMMLPVILPMVLAFVELVSEEQNVN